MEEKYYKLIEALEKIEQMSDCGSYETAIVRMKSIATEALKEFAALQPKQEANRNVEIKFCKGESMGAHCIYPAKSCNKDCEVVEIKQEANPAISDTELMKQTNVAWNEVQEEGGYHGADAMFESGWKKGRIAGWRANEAAQQSTK